MAAKKSPKLKKKIITITKRLFVPISVIILISVFATLSLLESFRQSATADEVSFIPAGISYVQTRDVRMNPENPPLIKYLSGLSVQASSHPVLDQAWETWHSGDQWNFGRQLLYFTDKNNPDKILFWGRLPILIIAIALGLLIFFWAKSMYGPVVGLAALAFYSLDPTMIAYSHLVTFDLPMAAFVTAAVYCLWLAYKNYSIWKYILAGFFLGLALTSKVSALSFVVLISIFIIPAAMKIKNRDQRIRFYLSKIGLVYAATFITIWFIYFVILGGKVWHQAGLLPNAFIRTLDLGIFHIYPAAKPMYLFGQLSDRGQSWYFPGSLLAKCTLIFLISVIAGLIYAAKKKTYRLSNTVVFLVIPVVFIMGLAINTQFSIGMRSIFIIFPVLFILAGYMVSIVLKHSRKAHSWVFLALIYYSFTLASAFPNYLAYSNELFGGRNHSYKYLADSNLDWGQGLKELKIYTESHNITRMPIMYFGEIPPSYYGFKTLSFGSGTYNLSPDWLKQKIPKNGGWFALSVSVANYSGLNNLDYRINGVYPKDVVAGSILVYQLPSR